MRDIHVIAAGRQAAATGVSSIGSAVCTGALRAHTCTHPTPLDRAPASLLQAGPPHTRCSQTPTLLCGTARPRAQVKLYGRNGCTARVVALHIKHPDTGAELGVIRAKVGGAVVGGMRGGAAAGVLRIQASPVEWDCACP